MNEPFPSSETRRRFIHHGIVLGTSGLVACAAASGADQTEATQERVSPNEDLMREHGVLNRVLIIYEEIVQGLAAGVDVPPEAVRDSAGIVRSYIEDYHEKLEQDFLFP